MSATLALHQTMKTLITCERIQRVKALTEKLTIRQQHTLCAEHSINYSN